MLHVLLEEFASGIPNLSELFRLALRLLVAMLCGFAIGFERERTGHAAGIRTHMLVALGACIFVVIPSMSHAPLGDILRVVQGVAAGIGFLGAGAILQLSESHQIKGLTTAAGLWVTTAIGIVAGLGRLGIALFCVLLTLVIMTLLHITFPPRPDPAAKPGEKL